MAEITGDSFRNSRALHDLLCRLAAWAYGALFNRAATTPAPAAHTTNACHPTTLCKEDVRLIFCDDLRHATEWQLRQQHKRKREVTRRKGRHRTSL